MASTGGGGFDEPARSTPVREWLLVLVVLAAGVVAVIGIYEAFQDASVRRTGAAAEGTLIGRSVGYRLPDRVRVAFATPDGHVVDRRFPVGNAQSYRYGTHVPVRYDPAHPSRAVLVHGQESRLVRPLVFGLLVGGVGVWGLVVAVRRRRAGTPLRWTRTAGPTVATVAAVVVSLIVATGLVWPPAVNAAPGCRTPPRPLPGPAHLDPGAMRQALDGTGLSEEGSGPLTPADAARVYGGNARLAALLASDGLDSGWVSYQTASGHQLLTFVLQFDDPVHARHFEAQRTVDLCAIGQRAPFDAGVPGADGLWTKSGTAQSRVALLRGSRDYYIEELGASGHYPPELRAAVRAVAAAAR